MKKIKYVFGVCLAIIAIFACSQDDDFANPLANLADPSNISANVVVTQDNTGLVTITPLGDGVTSFNVNFGDQSEVATEINPGSSIDHTYAEGTYQATITGIGLNGAEVSVNQTIEVSFQAPQNLVVTIENDPAISKQVNVFASADFAMFYEVDFGDGSDVVQTNIEETTSHIYDNAGLYTITVTAMGAAIETTSYTEVDFEVTAIVQPLASAPNPPSREDGDVISFFSDAYTDIGGVDYFPNWGQATTFNLFDLAGDAMLQYTNLNYQGIDFAGTPVDASQMEYLHVDIWTADDNDAKISPISSGPNETAYDLDLTAQQWTSFDIPLSFFTDQNPLVDFSDIIQFKFDGDPAGGAIFVDNLYFYRQSGGTLSCGILQDFESEAPAFTNFGGIGVPEVVSNPDMTGVNTSANVVQMTKTAGSEVWAGAFFDLTSPIDFNTCSMIRVKTWSPKLGAVVKLKIEESSNGDNSFEVDLNTTVTNAWEELTYDFSDAPSFNYDRVVIFFDFGVNGDDSIYYYDEIELVEDSGGPSALSFQDFEGIPPAFTVFGDIDPTQVVANPDMSGVNTTANVAQLTKSSGSQVWAGTFFDISTPLDLSTYSKISMKTWSPNSGIVVKLKIEDSTNGDNSFEVDLTTTVANSWEELVYDFSDAPAFTYDRIVVFFDFGNAGDGSVYYYDELELTN